MKCPKCREDNPEGARFCAWCANPFSDLSISDEATVAEEPATVGDLSLGEEATMVSGPGEGIVEEREIGSRYRVEEVLGRGGMGVVYRCRDGKLDREVAVKRLLAKEKASRAGLERFLREARTIAGLNHRNIVQVHDIGEDANGSYIVMEYIRGGTLKDRIRESGKFDLAEVLKLAKQIGQGLAHAHRKGVIHRDIKPANIFIDGEGVCKLGDFGLARFGTESELSMTGYGMGTLDYMPPEQRRDAKRADHRADIYSFGATLYEMAIGKSPKTVRESELPGELRRAVLKAMEERPEDRYFSVMELLEDLEKGGGKKPGSVSVGTVEAGKCPSCGHKNELSSKYCESCGVGLFGKCPKCSEEIRLGLKHCPKCGVDVEKREKFNSHIERGEGYSGEGKLSRAIKEYEAALELEPGDGGAKGKLSAAKESRLRIDNLLKAAAEARRDKEYRRERELLGEVLKIEPGSEEAVSRLMEVDKNIVTNLLKRAAEARSGKDYERERELLNEVLKIDPKRDEATSRLRTMDKDIDPLISAIGQELGRLVWVKLGSFNMGSDIASLAERPVHEVRIKRDFLIGKYPVTQERYKNVMGVNPSRFKGNNNPVEKVSWYKAIEFCRRASEILKNKGKLPEGWELRLPTEAEWEYACRAGTETPYYWGKELDGDYCWYSENSRRDGIFSRRCTHPVGKKKPNAWGIYDMIGNVWEWCQSLYKDYPYREDDGREDVKDTGPRVLRGGSWLSLESRYLLSSSRSIDFPGTRSDDYGFRIVLMGPSR